MTKARVFADVESFLQKLELRFVSTDQTRPWGGFYVIDETQAEQFAAIFFPELKLEDLRISGKLSPKILIVQAGKRLSWQYHFRRAEIWKAIGGKSGVVTSDTDTEGPLTTLWPGQVISLTQGQRHRLIGLDTWGVVAEIWQHTDPANPSDESDIVRLQDDFGR
ncbi:MAG: phosphoheptose isomerase [Cyclobacteriaceae bacterium]|nr:phosphoheptose isomerase [Cyclobacteriaceae bacterium]